MVQWKLHEPLRSGARRPPLASLSDCSRRLRKLPLQRSESRQNLVLSSATHVEAGAQ